MPGARYKAMTAKGMLRWIFGFSIVALLFFLATIRNPDSQVRTTLNVFGTLVEIIIRDADEATAHKAISAVSAHFRRMHRDWHAWEQGELHAVNQAVAAGRSETVSPFLLPLIHEAKQFHRLSDGLFNPAIGALVAAWGFHADEPASEAIPTPGAIQELLSQNPTMDDLIVDGTRIASRNRSVQLDFGGFAKGAALDRAREVLESFGIGNAVLNAGGDLVVLGDHGDRRWRAGIRHPLDWGIIASVDLNAGEGLFTSGNYERFRDHEGRRYTHIIDPRSGMPIDRILSVSVIHPEGALADAAATALCVAGPSDWSRIARRMGVTHVFLVDKSGTVYVSPEMRERVTFVGTPPETIVVGPRWDTGAPGPAK